MKTESKTFLIADREKALVDYLYFENLGKRPHNDRLVIKDIDKAKLIKYAKIYGRASLMDLVKRYL